MTTARMEATPVAVDRRNAPPMPLNEYVARELRGLGREFVIVAAVVAVAMTLLVLGGVR